MAPRAPARRKAILFFSTGDATRSQIAEGFFRAWSNSDFEPASTAIRAGEINPHCVDIMREVGVDISGLKSRTVKDSFRRQFIAVVAMCEVPRERCPIWPFTRHFYTWNIHDPGKPAEAAAAEQSLRQTRDEIAAKIKDFIAHTLPDLEVPAAARAAGGNT